jgi:hypothetical protein
VRRKGQAAIAELTASRLNMADEWRSTLESMRFRPHGDYGATRVMLGDVEIIAIPHPLKEPSLSAHYVSRDITAEVEDFVPLHATRQDIAIVLAHIVEQVHPERRSER